MKTTAKTVATPKKTTQSIFEIDGKKFKFTHKKYIGLMGIIWTEEAALKNPAELERLVMEKCGVIEEIKTPKKTK